MNAKQILVAGCAFFCGAGVVSAASYQPFAPQGGLAITTLLPSVYADGTDGTPEQVARMADSSVQQADANQPNGYVRPDSTGAVTLPVSGDSSAAPVTATGTPRARSLATREADAHNLSNYVSAYDGSPTFQAQVTSLYNSLGQNAIITLPCGASWPFYNTSTGLAWGPGGKGALFVDACGNSWHGAPGWGHDVAGVCQAYAQFSCWDAADPNRAKLLTVTNADPQFREALVLAGCLVADHLPDLTGGADHYYDHRGPVPSWAKGRAYRCVIGNHTFYRLGLRGDGK